MTVDFDFGVAPIQGSAAPTGTWDLRTSVNGAAYASIISASSDRNNVGITFLGAALLSGTTNSIFTLAGNGVINMAGAAGNGILKYNVTSVLAGAPAIAIKNANTNVTATSGTHSEFGLGSNVLSASGTLVYNGVIMSHTISNAGNGVASLFNISPTWTAQGGDAYFINYAPTVTSITGVHYAFRATAGNVLIGGTALTTSAILDLQSTTRAFIPPRMTTTQRDAISSPSNGMVVYNTSTAKLNVYTTAWEAVTSA
jgi:hypothetical protein